MAFGRLGSLGSGFGRLGSHGGGGAPVGPPESIALTGAPLLTQRVAGTTSGPVRLSGSYTGGRSFNVQARVLLVSDDSVVSDWIDIGATPSGGAWSGTISVPQGGPYYAEARTDSLALSDTGAAQFCVGAWFNVAGQSNASGLIANTGGTPADALDDTYYYNEVTGVVEGVPNTQGARNLANGLRTLLGIPVGIFVSAKAGVSIGALVPGGSGGYYESYFLPRLSAIGGDFEGTVFVQGEGDAADLTSKATWMDSRATIHAAYADACGRTLAQQPFALSGLGTTETGLPTTAESWATIQSAQFESHNPAGHVYYSHSNIDLLRHDEYHYTADSHGIAAQRFVQTMAYAYGSEAAPAFWMTTAAARVDATNTDITVVHGMGTDYTPTSSIVGFEISNDNGGSWAAATGVRQDATTVRLTHADLGTSERKVRYLYGLNPTVTGSLVDNGSLTVPLVPTGVDYLTAPAASAAPIPDYGTETKAVRSGTNNVISTHTLGVNALGPFDHDVLVIGLVLNVDKTAKPSSGALNPSTDNIPLTLYNNTVSAATLLTSVLPTGVTFSTAVLTYSANPFNDGSCAWYTVRLADLSSQVPTDVKSVETASVTSLTVDLTTSAAGFILAAAQSQTTDMVVDITGDESFAARFNKFEAGCRRVFKDASGISAGTASNTVTATAATSTTMDLIAVSFR